MRLTFLGGADEVGASSTLVEIGGKRLLVDAGIRISAKTRTGIGDDQLPDLRPLSDAGGPDYILVTHAHTDHTGALPLVVEQYPHVPVIATQPTFELIKVLQADAQRIMKNRQEQEGELPLFDELAVERLLDAFQPIVPGHTLRLGEGAQVTYHLSGHIIGAASLVLESDEGTLVLSGDLSLTPQRAVVKAAVPNLKADLLVLESTYGGKLHANRLAEEKRLIETLKAVIARGGKALIPAFALGRAQEVVQILLAHRDSLAAPVYVDGMVRAVCQAYTRFADWLPPETVRRAGDDALFFRNHVQPVFSRAQREDIARSEGAAVIVASSGMLTGGPSALYARHLAGDLRNAIFLTGYQDEEAPGRFLQRVLKERQPGEDIPFTIDGTSVTLRCELGTYSLSAHADEAELVSIAEALDADEVALVHGDPGARASLAGKLRARGRVVRLPQSGQAFAFSFAPRPWQLGVKTGNQTGAVAVRSLWESLSENAGNTYSARELAQMWWGEAERAGEMKAALLADGVHFAPDWRQRDNFQVHTLEQVTRALHRRAVIAANPDLVGKLIVLRDSHHRPRLGVVQAIADDRFEALMLGTRGRQFLADTLVWVIGQWAGPHEQPALTAALNRLLNAAKAAADHLLPFERRQALVAAGEAVNPHALLPASLPEDLTPEIALLAVIWTLANEGATVEQGGLLPRRAFSGEPLEQNAARQVAFELFPAAARLRKVGLDIHRKRLLLTFDFPARAAALYSDEIDLAIERTGWDVAVNPTVNQQALGALITELLPPEARLVKGPSFFLDRREVHADVAGVDDPAELERLYLDISGHQLRLNAGKAQAADNAPLSAAPTGSRPPMEINAAYALIRDALTPFGLLRTSLKQGQIILTFISPQVGARCHAQIQALAGQTGYAIGIHPHPDQNAILIVVNRLLREAGWVIRKGPGLHIDRAEILVTLAAAPADESAAKVSRALEDETGYRLVWKV